MFDSPVSERISFNGRYGYVSSQMTYFAFASATYVSVGVGRANAFGSGQPGFGYEGFNPSSPISVSQVCRLQLELGNYAESYLCVDLLMLRSAFTFHADECA